MCSRVLIHARNYLTEQHRRPVAQLRLEPFQFHVIYCAIAVSPHEKTARRRFIRPWQAWRSPASLLAVKARGSYEIDHLKDTFIIYYLSFFVNTFFVS